MGWRAKGGAARFSNVRKFGRAGWCARPARMYLNPYREKNWFRRLNRDSISPQKRGLERREAAERSCGLGSRGTAQGPPQVCSWGRAHHGWTRNYSEPNLPLRGATVRQAKGCRRPEENLDKRCHGWTWPDQSSVAGPRSTDVRCASPPGGNPTACYSKS